jgi:hypothetical protein
LEKELKRNIHKSKAYFEARVDFTKVLEKQKELIQRLEVEIKQKKADYNTSLRNLEKISEQIHEQRSLGRRDPGVGSETPGPAKSSPDREIRSDDYFESSKLSVNPSDQKSVSDEVLSKNSKPSLVIDGVNDIDHEKFNGDEDSRGRSASAPVDVKLDAPPIPPMVTASVARHNSGVILLASELSAYDWIKEDVRSKAFSFPPEDLDMQYKTVPEGVKQFPTPPETPSSAESNKLTIRHDFEQYGGSKHDSEVSSLASFSIDDEHIEHAMKLPDSLIKEIEGISVVDDLPERTSGSGAEDA